MPFIIVLLKRSTSPLLCRQCGTSFVCCIRRYARYPSNSAATICGPSLSLLTLYGSPCVANMVSKTTNHDEVCHHQWRHHVVAWCGNRPESVKFCHISHVCFFYRFSATSCCVTSAIASPTFYLKMFCLESGNHQSVLCK